MSAFLKKVRNAPHYYFFLICGLISGLIIIKVTPPFQSPDEVNHFYRIWQISNGQLSGVKYDNRVGGFLPTEFESLTKPFLESRYTDHPVFSDSLMNVQFNLHEGNQLRFYDFPNTAVYNAAGYFPQVIAVKILRISGLSLLQIYYGARIISLLFWLMVIYCALKILPVYRWLFTLLALLPMSVYINSFLSADMLINGISFLFIAHVFNLLKEGASFTKKQFFLFVFFAIGFCVAKTVYFPFLILLLLIPKNMYRDNLQRYSFYAIITVVTLVSGYFILNQSGAIYTPYSDYNVKFRDGPDLIMGANMKGQIDYMLNNPASFFGVFVNSLKGNAHAISIAYIGRLGWFNVDLPGWYIIIAYVFIVLVLFSKGDEFVLTKRQILICVIAFLSSIYIIILSQYLTWANVGDSRLVILQGRYFIPIFPVLFIIIASFTKRRINLSTEIKMGFALLGPVVAVITLCVR